MHSSGDKLGSLMLFLLVSLACGMLAMVAHAEEADEQRHPDVPESVGFVSSEGNPNAPSVEDVVSRYVMASGGVDRLPVSDKGGFIGADAAYNKPLDKKRRIWVFGDTLVGDVQDGMRADGYHMFRNAVAVEYESGNFYYHWGNGRDNAAIDPQGFFRNTRDGEWYWPADFVIHEGRGFFFLRRMKATASAKKGDVFGFEVVGVDVAVVTGISKKPSDWGIRYHPLKGFQYTGLITGVAAMVQDEVIYLLATDQPKSGAPAFYLAEAKLKDFYLSEFDKVRYYQPDVHGWGMRKPHQPMLEHGAPEASLFFDKERGKWRMIYSKPMSREIVIRESEELTHGWGDEVVLHRCAEAALNQNYFCYAGKEIVGGDALRLTYSVNSTKPADLSDGRIYVPRIQGWKLPKVENDVVEDDDPNAIASDFAVGQDGEYEREHLPRTDGEMEGYDSHGWKKEGKTYVTEDGYIMEGERP